MPWREAATGHFERPFDATDFFLKAVCLAAVESRKNWTISAIARLDVEAEGSHDLTTELKRPWTRTRYHHPTIAIRLEDDKFT